MRKVFVEFNSIEEAQAAIRAVSPEPQQRYEAPAPQYPQPAAPTYAPAAPQPGPYVPPAPPAAPAGYTPPQGANGSYAPPAGAPAVYAPPAPPAGQAAITPAQVAQAFQAYAKAHGPKAAQAKLKELGYPNIAAITPPDYARCLDATRV